MEPIEPPATVPAAVRIAAHEVLQHIVQAASRGPVDIRHTATLSPIERDRDLAGSVEHRGTIADRGHAGIEPR